MCRQYPSALFATFAVAVGMPCSVAPAQPQQATFQLINAGGSTYVSGVSADGQVLSGFVTTTASQAFRWTPDGDFHLLGEGTAGWGISGDGNVIVGQFHDGESIKPARWSGGWSILGPVPCDPGKEIPFGRAYDASDDGSVVVGHWNPCGIFRWVNGSLTQLGPNIDALATSSDGEVVVGYAFINNFNQAFRWTPSTGLVGLGTLGGVTPTSIAYALTPDGSVVVGRSTTSSGATAFRWTQATGMVSLGPVPFTSAQANAVSADGSRIVGEMGVGLARRAFVWDEENGVRDLKQVLLNDYGMDIGDVLLSVATGISDDGLTIVGSTTGPQSGWIVRLPSPDTDGDGLLDTWESEGQGLDVNGDGVIDLDLYALGARPDHKDLFIEIDHMPGRAPTNLQPVVEAFANAPVSNPDGVNGIKLHLLVDESTLPFSTGWGPEFTFDAVDNLKSGFFGTAAERGHSNHEAILAAKVKAFRYCIYADRSDGYAVGVARTVHCNDFVVFKGMHTAADICGGPPCNVDEDERATFMHELGHALGLSHGGGDEIMLKPNYISVMNYLYSLPFAVDDAWRLDYSRGQMTPVMENNIDESVLLQVPDGDHNLGMLTFYAIANCVTPPADPCSPIPVGVIANHGYIVGSGPYDFNNDNQITPGVCMDLNYYGSQSPFDSGLLRTPCQIMNDHNDWAALQYALVEETFPFSGLGRPPVNPPVELTISEIKAAHAAFPVPCRADITGDRSVNVVDLLAVINNWGACPPLPSLCSADIAPLPVDRHVNVADLLAVINAWGPCR